jgi:hypothetical protein
MLNKVEKKSKENIIERSENHTGSEISSNQNIL